MPRARVEQRMMVATESFLTRDIAVYAGRTLLWDDDPIVLGRPQSFRESEQAARPEVESAVNEPGVKRGEQR